MASQKPIAQILRELREERGETLRASADGIGVDAAHLSRVERGLKRPSRDLRQRAADYYGLPPEKLTAAAGELPADVIQAILENPEIIDEIRHRFG